jgi:VWFA-related protein
VTRRFFTWIVLPVAILAGAAPVGSQQAPTFRAGADIVVIDATVVAREGSPIEGLKPEQFEVFIDGRRRPVLSADFVRAARSPGGAAATGTSITGQPAGGDGRIIMLAVDEASFPMPAQQSAREAVTRVVDRVAPEDYLGMMTFPGSLTMAPTRDHGVIRSAITRIVGARVDAPALSRFTVSATEASQLRSRRDIAARDIIARECKNEPLNPVCPQEVMETADGIVIALEQQAMQTVAGLHRTLDAVSSMPGRKTLMVISAGLPMSTQPGTRPDFTAETARMASRAAAANVNLYVLYMNVHFLQFFSAANRTINHTIYADINLFGQGLERFADGAGGAFFQIEVDSDPFVGRALRETSASYVLSVRTDPKDQDGREHFIRVEVKARGATIRHRRVLVIPAGR